MATNAVKYIEADEQGSEDRRARDIPLGITDTLRRNRGALEPEHRPQGQGGGAGDTVHSDGRRTVWSGLAAATEDDQGNHDRGDQREHLEHAGDHLNVSGRARAVEDDCREQDDEPDRRQSSNAGVSKCSGASELK